MKQLSSISRIFGYTMAGILFIAGGLILAGLLIPSFPGGDRLRVLFGIVLMLYGIFRFVSVRFAARRERDDS